MAEAWAPKDQFGKTIKKNRLEGITPKQKKTAFAIIKKCSWLAASDKHVSLGLVTLCKHQMTMLLVFLYILDGKPARALKKLGTDIRNMNAQVVPAEDVITESFRKNVMAIVERGKNGPQGKCWTII